MVFFNHLFYVGSRYAGCLERGDLLPDCHNILFEPAKAAACLSKEIPYYPEYSSERNPYNEIPIKFHHSCTPYKIPIQTPGKDFQIALPCA